MSAVIEVKGLRHKYGDFTAVKGIDFSVEDGEIFSFLGPNGAGKSTTINILVTLLPLQTGSVKIAGYDLKGDKKAIRKSIGIVFQDEVLDKDLTVEETLDFHGRIYALPREERRTRIEEMLELSELKEKRGELVRNLSGGMKRRLEIARGLMTRPKILFLDEPTIGLDPQTRLRIWDYIRKVNAEGTTIFLTTHYMDEADSLSDRINIMDHGEIIAGGTPEELKNGLGQDMIYLDTTDNRAVKEIVSGMEGVNSVGETTRGLKLRLGADGTSLLPHIIKRINAEGVGINRVSMKKPTLDDVFVHYTGRELRDEQIKPGSGFRKGRGRR
jgi:ABC-2 type transport system ATP-binding protein